MTKEPWLRNSLLGENAVIRAVLHALQLAEEDLQRWCADLSDQEVHARLSGLPSVSFQLNHISGSLDRLLTYAEARELRIDQMAALEAEDGATGKAAEILGATLETIRQSGVRVKSLAVEDLEEARFVGREKLPTTLGGLLVHIAEHTQRHVGQAITTAKVVRHSREQAQ